MVTNNRQIGTSETAKILGISASSVRRLANDGKLKCIVVENNKYRKFSLSEILNFKKTMNPLDEEIVERIEILRGNDVKVAKLHNIKANSHPSHYLMHKYWGRKPYNVISSYITHFTEPGDIILDPFMGSGMVPIESVKNGRFGLGVDINPMSRFIAENTVSKVDIVEFNKKASYVLNELYKNYSYLYETKCSQCDKVAELDVAIWDNGELTRIKGKCENCGVFIKDSDSADILLYQRAIEKKNELVKNGKINYPKDYIFKYVKRSGVETLNDLFNDRALLLISELKSYINDIEDTSIKSLLKLAFTSMLPNVSKMLPGDTEKATYKSGWVISKFWVPKIHTERNVFSCFKLRTTAVSKGKQELSFINEELISLHTGDSSDLKWIENESIDYIFTDPPYGESIAYLALSQLWNCWLQNDVNYTDEIIIDNYREKGYKDYSIRMKKVFKELYRVLKNKSFLSFTFNNRDLNVWKAVMDAVKEAGFALEFMIYQGQAVTSGTQGINKKNTLTGDFIYTLYKDNSIEKSTPKPLKNNVEFVTQKIDEIITGNSEITPTKLYENLIPVIIEYNAYNDTMGNAIDIEKILNERYEYVEKENDKLGEKYQWQIRINE